MLVQEFLESSAERYPDKIFLISDSARLTYQELDFKANCLAHTLRDAGVMYGDRVVVLLDNSPETVVSIFGILKADGTFVVTNPTTKPQKLKYIIHNCRASALITHWEKWNAISSASKDMPSLKSVVLVGKSGGRNHDPGMNTHLFSWDEILHRGPATSPARRAIDIDLASLIYTSGTTGNPKGVMLTHRNMVSASTSITTYLENTEEDIILNILPLSFDYGLYQVLMAAQFGGTVVMERSFIYPYVIVNTLKKEKITGFPIVPTISAILLQLKGMKKEHFEHLRYITSTAAAMPVSHIQGLREIFPNVKIYSMYGLTECKRVSYLPPEELERRPTSVGKSMPNTQVFLVDEQNRIITEPDIVGELVVRGSNVMKGYWELPEETNKALRPWIHPWENALYTGDLFKMDAEGFLYYMGRRDDIIKSRGEKVSPKEIENVLYEMTDIVEAAVIAVPDDILGEAVKACIVLKENSNLEEKDIVAHCMDFLEDYMVPKYIEFRKSLPKTASGKITKKDL